MTAASETRLRSATISSRRLSSGGMAFSSFDAYLAVALICFDLLFDKLIICGGENYVGGINRQRRNHEARDVLLLRPCWLVAGLDASHALIADAKLDGDSKPLEPLVFVALVHGITLRQSMMAFATSL